MPLICQSVHITIFIHIQMYYPFQSCRSSRFVTVQSSIRYLTVSPLSLSITFCIPFHFQYTPPTELHHSFYALEFVEWLWKFHESYRLSTFILSITYFISLEGSTPFLSHGVHYLVLVLHNKIKFKLGSWKLYTWHCVKDLFLSILSTVTL